MGQSNSKGDKGSVPEYRPTFDVIRVIDDPNYGRVKLIREAKTHQQMILKEFVFDTKQVFEEELKFFKERAAFDHPNIVQVIGYNATQNTNLCSSLFKVCVFIEILSKELETVLKERKRAKNVYNENDLLLVAENVISALYHLQSMNMAHGDIRPVNIFFSGNAYKVTDPKLEIDKNANALVKAILNKTQTLLSPQLLAKVPTGKFEYNDDKYKADVFSLGATLLNVATLKNSEELYDYQTGKLNEALLNERLEEVKAQYSPFTYQLIYDMLRINEQERPDFVGLRDRLLPYQEAIQGKHDLPFLTHHKEVVPAGVNQPKQGERAKKAAVVHIDEDDHEEDRHADPHASDRHRVVTHEDHAPVHEPVFHHPQTTFTPHHEPVVVTEVHHDQVVPQFKSHFDDDLEAKIKAALERSQNTYKQVQAAEAYAPYQPQFVSHHALTTPHTNFTTQTTSFQHTPTPVVESRPVVSFGVPSHDFAHTQIKHDVGEHVVKAPRQVGFDMERAVDHEHRVMAPRQVGFDIERTSHHEHKVMAPRQVGFDVERAVEHEHRVMAPRQVGFDVERSTEHEHRVMAPRQVGFDVERAVEHEHRVMAPRQVGFDVERSTEHEHRVMAPRQVGFDVERSTEHEHRVMAPRQVGFDVERAVEHEHSVMAPRQVGFDIERTSHHEHRVMAPRQVGFEHETVLKSSSPQTNIHTISPSSHHHHVDVPYKSESIHTSETKAVPTTVETHDVFVPSTTAHHGLSYTSTSYTPNVGYATQNLGLLENLKKTSEAAYQQDLQRHSQVHQPVDYHHEVSTKHIVPEHHTYESVHTYQPITTTEGLYTTNHYNIGGTTLGTDHIRSSAGEHAVRSSPGYTTNHYNIGGTTLGTDHIRSSAGEHAVRSSPGLTDEVRKVGEVSGNSAINTGAFTYTSTGYTAGDNLINRFNLPKAAADDVMAFTPHTYTVEHTIPHTTSYGHHDPVYSFGTDHYQVGTTTGTQDYHFTTTTGHASGEGHEVKPHVEAEKVLKAYHSSEEVPHHEVAYSPTLPSVTPKHHVTNIQVGDFARGDTANYGTYTPTNAYGNVHVGGDRPGGILGEVSSAVSKYTFTTVDDGHHQFGDSPTRFI